MKLQYSYFTWSLRPKIFFKFELGAFAELSREFKKMKAENNGFVSTR